MPSHRNRYVKVTLFEPCATNLQGGTVVGQYGDTILVERAQPKERQKPAPPRKPKAKKPTPAERAMAAMTEATHG